MRSDIPSGGLKYKEWVDSSAVTKSILAKQEVRQEQDSPPDQPRDSVCGGVMVLSLKGQRMGRNQQVTE